MDDSDIKSEIQSFKIENENLKRENDRLTVDYELKLESLRKEISIKTSNYDTLTKNYQEIEAKFKNGCDDKMSLNQTYHDLSKEKFEIVKKFNTLESDYSTITELITRRENELLFAKNEIQELRTKLDDYQSKEIEMKLNERDLEYRKKDIIKIEELSYNRNTRLCDDIKTLEEKLSVANKELFDERSKHSTMVFDLNTALEGKRNELKNQKKLNEKLKENVSYLEKVYEEKTESLRAALEGKANVDSLLRKELNTQKQIIELLKSERDELIEKQTTFIQTITELQDAFRENCEDSCKMRDECELKLQEYSNQISHVRSSLNEKEKEIENANILIEKFRVNGLSEEELKAMNPATSAAIGALKRGYSLTQIYSEYLQVVTERNELKVDRDRLNEYIQSILEELEVKAPSLKKQQEERTHIEMSLSTIGQKYEKTLSDLFNCQSEAEEYRKKYEDLNRKLKREEQTSADLKQQVCCLLKEIETARGTVIRYNDEIRDNNNDHMMLNRIRSINQQSNLRRSYSSLISNSSSLDGSTRLISSDDVITTHLVTFKNICELQQQNIQLLEQFRDLSSQMEAQDGLINEQSLQQVMKKLENALEEVDNLRDKVKHQKQLEKIIDRQRHIIQALTTLTGKSDVSEIINKSSLVFDCSDNLSQSLVTLKDKDNLMTSYADNEGESKTKLAIYEKNINDLQLSLNKLKEDKELMRDHSLKITEELNKQITEMKVTNESLLAKLSYNQEKANALEQNLINRQLEINDLQEEVSESKLEIMQKKEELKSVRNELISSQSIVKNLEEKLNEMRKNMKHIESLEQQIRGERSEKYELIKNMNNFSTQISNLQSLLISSSKTEDVSESQQNLKTHVKQLTLELKQEKSKFQTSQEIWQAKINESFAKIDSLSMQLSKAMSGKVATAVSTADDTRSIVINEKSQEKREKMDNLEEQIEELIVANCNLKKQLESYQEILSNSEAKLITNSNLMEEIQTEFQEKINDEKRKTNELEQRLDNFQTTYEDLEIEYTNVKEALHCKINELEKVRDENNDKIDFLNKQITELNEKESLLKKDVARQRQLTKEAMDNYQQELVYHSQESDSLQEANETLRKYQTQERDFSQKLKEALLDRDQYKSDMETKELSWNEERLSLQNEIDELRTQSNTLNNRLMDLNDVVINLKKMLDPTLEGAVDEAVIHKESDWNDVVQYLRQQKENAENSKNQLEIDLYRLKNENSVLEENIIQLNNALEDERKFKLIEAETSKHHSEVMRKLETVQMLNESNVMLRKDRERMKDELREKTAKIASLQEMLEPLKIELRSKKNEIENLKLEVRSLSNERDLWRKRCDSLIEKSKQVNPEDFKKLCVEKDELQHTLLLEEEKIRNLSTSFEEMQQTISNQTQSLKEAEDELEELRRVNDENINVIQKRDVIISQLKDIGRKYKAEKESLTSDITKITEIKETQERELDGIRKELTSSKTMLHESMLKLKQQSDTVGSGDNEEYLKRVILLEKHLAVVKSENDMLKSQKLTTSNQDQDDHGDDNVEVSQPLMVHNSAPTVARVAANVHPVIQKPTISSGSNQISPSTSQTTGCQSTARQTAEIRPIPAVIVHASSSTSVAAEEPQLITSVSVTTSLPANVVQALAASSSTASVSTVIFPSAATHSSIASTPLRMKRLLNDIVDNNNVTTENSMSKKIRLRNPELGECSSQTTLTEEEQIIEPEEQHITSEERQDLEMIDEEEDFQEDLDDINIDDAESNISEEDYSEEEESDDEPECIELSSSDGNEEDDNGDEEDSYNFKDENEEEEDNVPKVDESVSQQQQHESDMIAEAKKKIEPITWTDTSDRSGSMSLPSTSSMQPRRPFSKFCPTKASQQLKPRLPMFPPHRTKAVASRSRTFQSVPRGTATRRLSNSLYRRREFPQ